MFCWYAHDWLKYQTLFTGGLLSVVENWTCVKSDERSNIGEQTVRLLTLCAPLAFQLIASCVREEKKGTLCHKLVIYSGCKQNSSMLPTSLLVALRFEGPEKRVKFNAKAYHSRPSFIESVLNSPRQISGYNVITCMLLFKRILTDCLGLKRLFKQTTSFSFDLISVLYTLAELPLRANSPYTNSWETRYWWKCYW